MSPYTFDSTTGEFKITAFSGANPNSYFVGNFILKVNSDYKSGTTSSITNA
jgi:hypothetical protein